jgi:hypothetical protein
MWKTILHVEKESSYKLNAVNQYRWYQEYILGGTYKWYLFLGIMSLTLNMLSCFYNTSQWFLCNIESLALASV